ncbi:MAG: GtrA family protein [Nocardioidaceae bacterium]
MPADHATRRRSDAAHHQALRFLAVGATTVVIDFVVYQGLHLVGVPLTPAKALSFIVATVCAYFFNQSVHIRRLGWAAFGDHFLASVWRHARRQRIGQCGGAVSVAAQ